MGSRSVAPSMGALYFADCGEVSLKDTEHTISVTQSADTGTQLSVKAFVYVAEFEDLHKLISLQLYDIRGRG